MSPLVVRAAAAASLMLLWMGLEALFPRRRLTWPRARRWPSNLGLVALDQIVVRLLPITPVAWAAAWSGGLLAHVDLPGEDLLAVIALDAAIWLQHVMFHRVPWLWRLHRVHHSDPDYDVTTALRFHPVEIVLSVGVKLGVVTLLGPSPAAVLTFEVLLNGMAMFNHANLRLPDRLDAMLRLALVTPDVHRVHHSVLDREKHSNFGFNLSIWDRLFGTWVEQPQGGHEGMRIGDEAFPGEVELGAMLAEPGRRAA
ncbi:MAG TPA: sterol desaturase family protein [Myxococcota bacterium]|nr:sterol desaturase family protein [Myxococcota bacterium]